MPDTARQALADASATLSGVTDWRPATDDAIAAQCAQAIEGHGEWRWLIVRFPVPAEYGGGHGYDGTATHAKTGRIVRLTREVAVEAWHRGDAAVRGVRFIS